MSDGTQKISVNGDELLQKHNEWTKGEGSDASNSGTRRQAIGAYAEKCGLETKALSQFRSGLKIKNEGKRKDWLRSMQMLLPVAEREIFDNDPDLPLDNPNEDAQQAAANEANAIAEEHGAGDDDPVDFNAAVDANMGDDGNITPFGGGCSVTVLVKAFGPFKVSPAAEAHIGRLMKDRAVAEGHKPRLPQDKVWNAQS